MPHEIRRDMIDSPLPEIPNVQTQEVDSSPDEPLRITPGYGLRVLRPAEIVERKAYGEADGLDELLGLMNVLLVWEPPRRGHLYVIGVDVCSGMNLDRSVIDVTRVGTIREGEEQVAQFVSGSIEPTDLAYYIDPIGRFYRGHDQLPAMVAIECNGFGLGTQSELLRHVGYDNLFIWQHEDAVTPEGRYTPRYGWWTSSRTRPLILQRYFHAIKTLDKNTGFPDYRINSLHTLRELANFVTAGALWDAQAADGANDDCIMAGAISVHIAQTIHYDTREPINEARRRISEEAARAQRTADKQKRKVNWQNSDISVEELDPYAGGEYVNLIEEESHYL